MPMAKLYSFNTKKMTLTKNSLCISRSQKCKLLKISLNFLHRENSNLSK